MIYLVPKSLKEVSVIRKTSKKIGHRYINKAMTIYSYLCIQNKLKKKISEEEDNSNKKSCYER